MSTSEIQTIVGLAELAQILRSPENWQERVRAALERVHALLRSERTTLLVTFDGQSSLFACPPPPREEQQEPVAALARLLRDQVTAQRVAPTVYSHLALPLVSGEEEVGMLLVERHGGDGGDVYGEPSLQLLSVVASQLGAYVGYCVLVAKDRRLREAETSANELQRLLVGVVSHDLRSPLSAILMGTSLLLPRLLNERDATVLNRMTSSAQRAIRIINDLLDLTRAQSAGVFPIGKRRSDAAAIAREVSHEVGLANSNRLVHLTGADHEIIAHIDPDRVAQGLTNLLGNAVQHGASGQPIELVVTVEGDAITYRVHNVGTPIASDMLPRMFDPFLRGTRTTTGLGLGLYIVDQIVRAHGGEMQVTSSEATGTTFAMKLPLDLAALDNTPTRT